ncbi:MAG TPA: hypothetical protein DCS66_14500 [Flavobacteriaceae bacterium]|nr:hypothetical protein [Flavobacteriaceae bacterium]HAT65778.1 hypothetical protein [Flavobacteriaceae bacterium]|tara:strand:+ start:73305 stop:74132 length:828 start_codon:yes stop_codon:yes gene_type:complete
MNKLFLFSIFLLISFSVSAQKKPKIQGDKNVVDVYNSLGDFDSIEIGDGLEVSLSQAASNGYHLKTDENLVPMVQFEVIGNLLKVYTLNRIISSKALEINITVNQLTSLKLKEGSTLTSKNKLIFDSLDLEITDDSKMDSDLEVGKGVFILSGHSDSEFLLRGQSINIVLNDNAKLKCEVVLETLAIEVNQKADLEIEGVTTDFKLIATGSSDIKAKKLKATNAILNSSNSSDVYIYAGKDLSIYASGKSEIYVYGNPNIQVEGLNDKSQIIKKK